MTIGQIAGIAAAMAFVVLSIVIAAVIWFHIVPILKEFNKTIASVNKFIDDANKEIVPTLNKLQTTVEEVNQELEKVNEATAALQSVTTRVDNIANLVQEVISSPLIKVASYSAGASKAIRSLAGGRSKASKR